MQDKKRNSLKQCKTSVTKIVLILLVLLFCLGGLIGCPAFNRMGDMETPASMKIEWPSWFATKISSPWRPTVEIPDSGDALKRIAVVVYEDVSIQRPPEIRNYVLGNIPHILSQTCGNLVLPGGDSGLVISADALPRLITGDIDNYALAEAGRALGLNTIIIVRLMQVNSVQKFSGYVWWRSSVFYATFDVRVEVYDTVSAVKLVDGSGSRQVEIDENLYTIIKQNNGVVPVELIMPAFNDFVQTELAPIICTAVNAIPWQAGIYGNGQRLYRIPGGGAVGLVVGDAMALHTHGYVIQGIAGEKFWYQGPVTGLARVIEVQPDYAEIEILEGPTRFDFGVVSKKLN